jgi:hypothetical protein
MCAVFAGPFSCQARFRVFLYVVSTSYCSFSRFQTGFLFPQITRWKCGSRKPAEKPETVRQKLLSSFALPQKTQVRKRSRSLKHHLAVRSRTGPPVFAKTGGAQEKSSQSVCTHDLQARMWRNHTRTSRACDAPPTHRDCFLSTLLNSPMALEQFLPEQTSPFLMHRNRQRGDDKISRMHWFCSNGNGELLKRGPLIRKPDANIKHGIVRPSFARQRTCLVRGSRMTYVGFSRTSVSEHQRKRPFAIPAQNGTQPSSSPGKNVLKNLFCLPRQKPFSVSNKPAFSLFAMGF